MTNSIDLKECFKNLIGWRQHYNTDVVQIDTELTKTETGEYYQDYHPALQLNIIAQSLERDRNINEYLKEKVGAAIIQLSNDIEMIRQANGAKDILSADTMLNKHGYGRDTILNDKRFVGFLFEPKDANSLSLVISAIGFQVTIPQDGLNLYVYHSSQAEALSVIPVDLVNPISWNWISKEISIYSQNKNIQGGRYYIGYYQDDLLGYAINYTDFDWNAGHCGTCDGGRMRAVWNRIRNYTYFMPMYIPLPNVQEDRSMFDEAAVMFDAKKSWGLNFQIAANCDYTDLFCKNRKSFKNALGLKVAQLVLMDIKFSQQFNYINESMRNLIIMDLEGDKTTNEQGIAARLQVATNNVYLDTSGFNSYCLPCSDKGGVEYGVA